MKYEIILNIAIATLILINVLIFGTMIVMNIQSKISEYNFKKYVKNLNK